MSALQEFKPFYYVFRGEAMTVYFTGSVTNEEASERLGGVKVYETMEAMIEGEGLERWHELATGEDGFMHPPKRKDWPI